MTKNPDYVYLNSIRFRFSVFCFQNIFIPPGILNLKIHLKIKSDTLSLLTNNCTFAVRIQ